ncbi:MAG TPA: hypothetical protein PKM16_05060 [Bacteroidia bacterium]|nr:hypothetical protein [Bacteroidia bacterium]
MSKFLYAALFLSVLISACEKGPGEGGNSSIKGYVHVVEYNASFSIVQGQYPGADADVYIIYGDDISYGDRVRANYDGTFEFKYLREGKYTVYVYSEDSTQIITGLAADKAITKQVEITAKKQTIDAGTFRTIRN